MPRAKQTERQRLVQAARAGEPVQRVAIPRTSCPRCGTEQYALPSGEPRPHLRPAVQGDLGWSELVPTMTTCGE